MSELSIGIDRDGIEARTAGAVDERISVVIPSWDATRNVNLKLLIDNVNEQSMPPAEVRVVEKTSPNGHARNVGAEATSGDILIFLDDDIQLGSDDVFQVFAKFLRSHSELGMVGTSQLLPPNSSRFQRKCAEQLSRSQSDVVGVLTDSDMVTTQCCAMRRSVFTQVSGFHDKILRGVDPEMRNRVRDAGYRIAVAPNVWHYHPMPSNIRALLRMAWRDGAASAYARRYYPEAVLFNPEGHTAEFQARKSLPARIAGNAGRLVTDIISGKWHGAAYGLVYASANILSSVCRFQAGKSSARESVPNE